MALKNMEKLDASVRPMVGTYCEELISKLGQAVKSISAYGSATGPDFVTGKSDVNLTVVLDTLNHGLMGSILETVQWGMKKKIAPPLLLTPAYIASSLDVFPIEFFEIRDSQVVLYGEDQLASLEIKPEDVRLECESQLKGALLRTRQAYLEVGLKRKGAEQVLHTSLTSLIPVFRAMLRLKGIEVPGLKLDVVRQMGEAFGIDTSTFVAILHDKAGDEKIGGQEAHRVLGQYVEDLQNLCDKVDQI